MGNYKIRCMTKYNKELILDLIASVLYMLVSDEFDLFFNRMYFYTYEKAVRNQCNWIMRCAYE